MGPGNKCRDDSVNLARANLFCMRCVKAARVPRRPPTCRLPVELRLAEEEHGPPAGKQTEAHRTEGGWIMRAKLLLGALFPALATTALAGPPAAAAGLKVISDTRSEEHTSELQSLMRISYAVF